MAYRIAVIPITLSDLQGHSFAANLFKFEFSHSFAAVDKISTAIGCRAVSLRELSFLLFVSICRFCSISMLMQRIIEYKTGDSRFL